MCVGRIGWRLLSDTGLVFRVYSLMLRVRLLTLTDPARRASTHTLLSGRPRDWQMRWRAAPQHDADETGSGSNRTARREDRRLVPPPPPPPLPPPPLLLLLPLLLPLPLPSVVVAKGRT
jgi:hypothetical protein